MYRHSSRRRRCPGMAVLLGTLGAITIWAGGTLAQDAYPNKPVKIIVGMPAGSFNRFVGAVDWRRPAAGVEGIVRHRESAGRCDQHRDAERRPVAQGWLHAAAGDQFERDERQSVQGAAVRCRQGFPAGCDDRVHRLHSGGDAVAAGIESQGTDRIRQKPSGYAEFRVDRIGTANHLAVEMLGKQAASRSLPCFTKARWRASPM